MNHRYPVLFAVLSLPLVLSAGCAMKSQSNDQKETASIHNGEDDRVAELSKRVYSSRGAAAEATALQMLHSFELEHGLTHEIHATRTDSGAEVLSPKAYTYPLLVTVRIRRAGEVIHSFSFVPLNNANLSQLER
jgi:hypothetical protein